MKYLIERIFLLFPLTIISSQLNVTTFNSIPGIYYEDEGRVKIPKTYFQMILTLNLPIIKPSIIEKQLNEIQKACHTLECRYFFQRSKYLIHRQTSLYLKNLKLHDLATTYSTKQFEVTPEYQTVMHSPKFISYENRLKTFQDDVIRQFNHTLREVKNTTNHQDFELLLITQYWVNSIENLQTAISEIYEQILTIITEAKFNQLQETLLPSLWQSTVHQNLNNQSSSLHLPKINLETIQQLKLMEVNLKTNNKTIDIYVTLPLYNDEALISYRLIPIPIIDSEKNLEVIEIHQDHLILDDGNRPYYYTTQERCPRFNRTIYCTFDLIEYAGSPCEYQLLQSETIDCKIIRDRFKSTYTYIPTTNEWIIVATQNQDLTISCNKNNHINYNFSGIGLVSLDKNCELITDHIPIQQKYLFTTSHTLNTRRLLQIHNEIDYSKHVTIILIIIIFIVLTILLTIYFKLRIRVLLRYHPRFLNKPKTYQSCPETVPIEITNSPISQRKVTFNLHPSRIIYKNTPAP